MKYRKLLLILLIAAMATSIVSKATAQTKDTYLSDEVQGYCADVGEHYGICPELLIAIIESESSGNPKAENNGCIGLMQINPAWHSARMARLIVVNIYDEYSNILVGADILAGLFDECSEASWVLDRYNGNNQADYNLKNGILSPYAKKILERSAELEELHGK